MLVKLIISIKKKYFSGLFCKLSGHFFSVYQGHIEFQFQFLPSLSAEKSISMHINNKDDGTEIWLVLNHGLTSGGTALVKFNYWWNFLVITL